MTTWEERAEEARNSALTVQGLLDALNAIDDKSLPIEIEGCDCEGWASRAYFEPTSTIRGYRGQYYVHHAKVVIERADRHDREPQP